MGARAWFGIPSCANQQQSSAQVALLCRTWEMEVVHTRTEADGTQGTPGCTKFFIFILWSAPLMPLLLTNSAHGVRAVHCIPSQRRRITHGVMMGTPSFRAGYNTPSSNSRCPHKVGDGLKEACPAAPMDGPCSGSHPAVHQQVQHAIPDTCVPDSVHRSQLLLPCVQRDGSAPWEPDFVLLCLEGIETMEGASLRGN